MKRPSRDLLLALATVLVSAATVVAHQSRVRAEVALLEQRSDADQRAARELAAFEARLGRPGTETAPDPAPDERILRRVVAILDRAGVTEVVCRTLPERPGSIEVDGPIAAELRRSPLVRRGVEVAFEAEYAALLAILGQLDGLAGNATWRVVGIDRGADGAHAVVLVIEEIVSIVSMG